MKFVQFALLACFISVMPQKSEAFVYGTDEKMFFHSDTQWDEGGNEISLCVLRKRYHLMWLAVWSNYSYVLAENQCDTDSLYFYDVEVIEQDIASGELTTITSPIVPLTLGRVFWGFTLLLLVIPVVLFGIWAVMDQSKRNKRRAALLANVPAPLRGPLGLLLQAALADGTADDHELKIIVGTLKDLYGARLTVPQLREIVDQTDVNLSATEIEDFLKSANAEERHKALRLIVLVTAADGNIDQSELKYAVEAGAKLGFTQDDVMQIYRELQQQSAPEA